MGFRVVIDARHIRDFGIGTYIRSLVHALGTIDAANFYTLVVLPQDVRTLAGLPRNFDVCVSNRTDEGLIDNLAFPALLHRLSPDLVHIPLNHVPWFMRKPYVVTIHDMASVIFEDKHNTRSELHRLRFRRGLARAQCIIAVSDATRRDVEKVMNIPADRIRLVYNAPSAEFFSHALPADARAGGPETGCHERKRILERYSINYPFLLYAGNIRPQKNIPRLVEAFAVVRERLAGHPVYADLRLIIIGDEISQYPQVRKAVIQSRVEHAVRFLGFVPFDTLRNFYEAAAAFVFPSLYEGFGLPPLEAMASGTPVVTSAISSLPEVVGDAAMLVNPEHVFDIARGILQVLLDENLRHRLIARGREHASRYSWERTATEVLRIYREVIEKKRS